MKILIIDDDPAVTKLLKAKLEARPGVRAETTNVPSEGLDLALTLMPDIIVCDIDMEEGGGGAVAHTIGSQPATADIPIVFLSSLVRPEDMTLRSGGRRLISKQIPISEIITAILKEVE